jgi:hypothetical protein
MDLPDPIDVIEWLLLGYRGLPQSPYNQGKIVEAQEDGQRLVDNRRKEFLRKFETGQIKVSHERDQATKEE